MNILINYSFTHTSFYHRMGCIKTLLRNPIVCHFEESEGLKYTNFVPISIPPDCPRTIFCFPSALSF